MPLPSIMRQTVTAVKRVKRLDGSGNVVKDPHGIPIIDEQTFDVPRCSLQPVSTAETLGSADMTVSMWQLFAPPTVDLTSVDAIRVGTLSLEVVGDPQTWPSPGGRPHHVEVLLRKATG